MIVGSFFEMYQVNNKSMNIGRAKEFSYLLFNHFRNNLVKFLSYSTLLTI